MFYYNAKYGFSVEAPSAGLIAGGIIAASAILAGELRHRDFRRYPYLQQRLLDPQLYMAGIDRDLDAKKVVRLASYPWFINPSIPEYDSRVHASPKWWKDTFGEALLQAWNGQIPSSPADLERAVRGAVRLQTRLGCTGIILPGPLTTIADQSFDTETRWIDCGAEICAEERVSLPVFATVALSEAVLHGVPPAQHPLIHTISNQISTRREISGIYIVVEQAEANSYVWTSRDALRAILMLIDDIVRGAGKQAIVNYFGTFGAVAAAAGAQVWSSGYYLSQRRLNLSALQGRARPRYYSIRLAGDIGVENDLKRLCEAGLGDRLITGTTADHGLRRALAAGMDTSSVPEWQYTNSNIGAASRHYTELLARHGLNLSSLDPTGRVRAAHQWLRNAVDLANQVARFPVGQGQTDTTHQRVWLDVFEEWQRYSGA